MTGEESCRLHFLFLDSAEELVTVMRQLLQAIATIFQSVRASVVS
jgi:hypothetical protein